MRIHRRTHGTPPRAGAALALLMSLALILIDKKYSNGRCGRADRKPGAGLSGRRWVVCLFVRGRRVVP